VCDTLPPAELAASFTYMNPSISAAFKKRDNYSWQCQQQFFIENTRLQHKETSRERERRDGGGDAHKVRERFIEGIGIV